MKLDEPSSADDTYARRLEHPLDWLKRSTTPRAAECRRFLNEHLHHLAAHDRRRLVHDLRERWESAFFELIVARVLQLLGADVTLEEAVADGHRPDFRATFEDAAVVVEATAPRINREVHTTDATHAPLMDILEKCVPDGWAIGVFELPPLGPADSKREFKREVQALLDAVEPPSGDEESRLIDSDTSAGPVRFMLLPRSTSGGDRVLSEPGGSFCDDTETRILRAVKRKRSQVRECDLPVVLAICAGGLVSRFEHFDMALFGHSYSRLDINGRLVEKGFRPDGVFGRTHSSDAPTYAAVLAFLNVGFGTCQAPVLYIHPRFEGHLPTALRSLERRTLRPDGQGICVAPAGSEAWLSGLHLVSTEV